MAGINPLLQGAQNTERTENARAELVDPATGESVATENSENKRAQTIANKGH